MIPIEIVNKLKPGTILFHLVGQVGDQRIVTTPPVQKRTTYRVYFERISIATHWSPFRGKGIVVEEYFLTEKGAFLGAIIQLQVAKAEAEERYKNLTESLSLSVEAAKKKRWL